MDLSVIVGIATGSVALCSLIILIIVFLLRRRHGQKMRMKLSGSPIFHLPPKTTIISDEELERRQQQDPPVQQVSAFRPRVSHSPTMHSMSTESPIISPVSNHTRNSLSRTSTITNNNFPQYQAYSPRLASSSPSSSSSSPISPTVPRLPPSLVPGSRISPPPNAWLPSSANTHTRRMSYDYAPSNLSPTQHPDPTYHMDSPLHPRPMIIKRRSTIDVAPYTSYASLYSIAERPVVYTAKHRYYSAQNTTRIETLVHMEGKQTALPELEGSR